MRRLLFFLFLSLPLFTLGQDYTQTLRGTVIDAETRKPLEGATVVLLRENVQISGKITDSTGAFRFEKIQTGRYGILITLLGYETGGQQNLILNSGKELVLTLPLREQVITAEEVVITAGEKSEARNDMTTVSSRQFTIEETMRYAGSWNDPSRMASNFAGVQNENDSRNDIIIRGNSPTGLLWRLEGTDIPNPNHFGAFGTTGGPVSMLNNNLLDNSDFMTGAWPAEYGNALGGVFDLRMRKGNDEQHEFLGQFGFNGLEFGAEGPISRKHKSSYLINYRYSTLEMLHWLGIRFGTSAQPKYQDLSFKLNFPSAKLGDLSIWGLGGLSNAAVIESERDSTDFFGPAGNDIWYGTNTGAAGLNHFKLFGDKTWIRTTLSISGSDLYTIVDHVERDTWVSTPFYRNTSSQTRINGAFHFNHKFSPRHSIRTGIFVNRLGFNLSDSVQVDTTTGWQLLTDFKGGAFLIQPYAQYKYRINSKLTLNAGFFYQHYTFNNTGSAEPRVGLRWDVGKKQSLSFAVGQHSQLQPMYVYFAGEEQPGGEFVQTNENLKMTKSRHAVLAWDLNLTRYLRIKSELFYQHLYDVPVNANGQGVYSMLNEGADYYFVIPDSLANTGTGRNYGAEITIEKFFSKNYYFLFTGTLYDSKYTAADGIERNTRFNGKYTLHLLGGAQYTLGKKKRWIAGFDGRITLAGGKFYTPLDEAASTAQMRPVYLDSLAFTLQYPAYFRVDGRIKIRLNSKKISQEFALDVTNVLNRQNILNEVYDRATNSLRLNYQLGFFPVIQYRVEF